VHRGAGLEGGAAARDRILLSFSGFELSPAEADDLVRRAAGVTLYRHLNVRSAAQVRALTDTLQAAAARMELPRLIIAADHETGQLHAMGDDATPFAGAMALGATGDALLAEQVARAIGTELGAMGVNLVYAPVCDLATNPRTAVVGIRSFGDDPVAVGRLAAATVRGLQAAGVAATAKHFPGHGDPASDSHLGLPVVERSADELRERELVPFQAAIDAGVRLTMAGHLAIPSLTGRRDVPATLAPEVLRTLLRADLGFGGLTVTDALDMGGIAGDGAGVDVTATLDAGMDLLLCGPDLAAQQRVEAGLAAALAGGRIDRRDAEGSQARLTDLRAWLGRFEPPSIDVVGNAEHRALAGELARRSITVVRDDRRMLPFRIEGDARVLVIEPRPRLLTPADTTASLSSGGLVAGVRERHAGAVGALVEAAVTSAEIAVLRDQAASVDLVILGTVDALGEPSVAELARALVASGTPVIAVALRAPWDASAYPEVGTVLATYGIQPPSLTALVAALWGDATTTGLLPVMLGQPPAEPRSTN
jgi:beta-N-acetylhexosaminidase